MGKTPTPALLVGTAATIAVAALLVPAFDEPHAAPHEIAVEASWLFDDATAVGPSVANAAVSEITGPRPSGPAAAMRFQPAPMGETRNERSSIAPRDKAVIAVGHRARGMMDPAIERAFGSAADLDVTFSTCGDRDAVELMMLSRVDMALLGGQLSQREIGAGLREARVGLELFALAVAADFPRQSLSRGEMRQLLTGEISSWQQLGCDRGAVVVVTPAETQLARRAASTLIHGDNFTASAVRVAGDRHVADQLLRNPGAIAIVRVGAVPPTGMKLLQLDWTPPTADAFQFGNYPYGVPLHVVTTGDPDAFARLFLEFAQSEDGRELLGRTLLLP